MKSTLANQQSLKMINWQFYMTWKKMALNPEFFMIIPEVSRGQSIGLTFSGGCTWRSNTVIMNGGRCGDSFNSRVTLIGSIWGKILLFAFPLSFVLFSAKMIIFFSLSSHFSFRQVKMDLFLWNSFIAIEFMKEVR